MTEATPTSAVVQRAPQDTTLRTDLWIHAFDGIYRMFLPLALVHELERKCGHTDREGINRPLGLFGVYGRIAKGRYELDGQAISFAVEGQATIDDCLETVRLAVTGGGHAIVAGEQVQVSAQRASQLVAAYLTAGPVEEAWDLAYLILTTSIKGRKQGDHEDGTLSTQAVYPPVPVDPARKKASAKGKGPSPEPKGS